MNYKGIVSDEIFGEFSAQNGVTLINHAANSSSIEDTLAVAKLFCPDFIEVDGCIFVLEFYQDNIEKLKVQFSNDKKKIEMFVNSWALGDFFIGAYSESIENEKIIMEFGKALVYFWERRLRELFPKRTIIVEVGEEIMGESGLTIMVYQA